MRNFEEEPQPQVQKEDGFEEQDMGLMNTNLQNSSDVFRFVLGVDLEELKARLEGRMPIIDYETKKTKWIRTKDPIVPKNTDDIIIFISSLIDKNITLSNLTEEEVKEMQLDNMNNFVYYLACEAKRLGIKKPRLSYVRVIVDNPTFCGLKKAMNAKMQEFFTKQSQLRYTTQMIPTQSRKKLFGVF